MKNLIIISLLFTLCSCKSQKMQTNRESEDYAILNSIIEKAKSIENGKMIYLYKMHPNNYVIHIIESKRSNDMSNASDSIVSQYGFINIEMDDTLREIFNTNEYQFLLSQNSASNWDSDKIIKDVIVYEDEPIKNGILYKISKPIYTTSGKYALVCINKRTWQGILVMKKIKQEWVEYKLIAPMSIQPKIQLWK